MKRLTSLLTRPLLAGAVLIVTLAVVGCATTTSSTGRRQFVGGVSQQQLNALGIKAFAETKGQESLSQNTKQTAYVRCVVNDLVAQLPAQQRAVAWETALFQNDEPNAFALPGGKVGVYTGIFKAAKNQDQLAAVLAHEIGHVVERHHEERMTRQVGASTAVSLLGALAGDYGQLASQGGSIIAQTGFLLPGTRAQESEADVVGQRLMAQAGFDPNQAINLWQNMIQLGGQRQPQWLSTHPDPSARIRELQSRAASLEPIYAQARSSGHVPRCG